jgi:putative ABC transport system permease protein
MKTFQPEYATNVRYFSDIIDSSYKTESRLEEIISAFSVLTILIACLGLFGLISFITEVRQREIAIRKVLGATSFQIGAAFVREMISLIILSSVLAIPISLYVIQKWLSNFAYQTEIDLRKLVFTALLIYAMSIIVVFYQVHKASIKNPVDALKHE